MKFVKRLAADGRPFYKFDVRGKKVVIPGDIHIPNQDSAALKAATITAVAGIPKKDLILFLQGDTVDMEGFNRFPKDPSKMVKRNNIKREKAVLKTWLERWKEVYSYIVFAPGNHEERAHKMVFENAAFVGMGWWWPYGGLLSDSRIILLDVGYQAELDFGTKPRILVEHGHELRGAGSRVCPAAGVAEENPGDQLIAFGHTHRTAQATHTRFIGGRMVKTTAINVGTVSDFKKNGYAKAPNWQGGTLYLSEDEHDLRVW